ncbi:MAG: hypothetical protein IPK58_23960 [Acidobacteria bacterium]|nr:hypothetical protein [Acidobacteriota bacterium]
MPVIFGSYPFISTSLNSPLRNLPGICDGYDSIIQNEEFEVEVDAITSGLLFGKTKAQLPKLEKLYQDDLAIPAEE